MDFIVLGGILGAFMMVAGTVLRDVVPRCLRITGDDTPWVEVRDRRRTVRSVLASGRMLTIAGVVVLVATALLVAFAAPDATALAVVIGLAVLGLVASGGWVLWFRYQESSGAIQRRQLQLIASRLGPARPPAERRSASSERGARAASHQSRRPAADLDPNGDPRTVRRGAPGTTRRRGSETGESPENGRRAASPDDGRRGIPQRSERSAERRDPDHHPVAHRQDRSTPRPSAREPQRRPVPQGPESGQQIRRTDSPKAPPPRGPGRPSTGNPSRN